MLISVEAACALGVLWFGIGLLVGPFFFGGGGAKLLPSTRGSGPEAVLAKAGLAPVTMAEWRGEREGHPCRVVFSRVSLRCTVELALGSAPGIDLDVSSREGDVRSTRPELARDIVAEAAEATSLQRPAHYRVAISGRTVRVQVERHAFPDATPVQDPYGPVVWALAHAMEIARALEARGEGLPPFETDSREPGAVQ